MPDLSEQTVTELRSVADRFLGANFEDWKIEGPPGVGGSAAVFKASKHTEFLAIKVYDPKFLEPEVAASQLKRIELQKLITEIKCDSLVRVHALENYNETCVCVMEFVPWQELKEAIGKIPAANIQPIVDQLVNAVIALKNIGLIHRDIKPENILIAPDLKTIKVVDFGVVREISSNEDRPDSTDHGKHRPFLATAQYSSPEYLFRTAEPSEDLWNALNLYQIGAVIHDLIAEEALFADEMRLQNRYRLALAVLSKRPKIPEAKRQRNYRLASISEACLIKNSSIRLSLVNLTDFFEPGDSKVSQQLKVALTRLQQSGDVQTSASQQQAVARRVEDFLELIFNSVFDNLNATYDATLLINRNSSQNTPKSRVLVVSIPLAKVEYKFMLEAEATPEFEFNSEVEIVLKHDKETHSRTSQGTISLDGDEISSDVADRIVESISKILIAAVNK